jgi:hypothetical protein
VVRAKDTAGALRTAVGVVDLREANISISFPESTAEFGVNKYKYQRIGFVVWIIRETAEAAT